MSTFHIPADYVRYVQGASKKLYQVKYIDHGFFKDFSEVGELMSIRPGCKADDPTVADICALKYTADGKVYYKLNHPEAWKALAR